MCASVLAPLSRHLFSANALDLPLPVEELAAFAAALLPWVPPSVALSTHDAGCRKFRGAGKSTRSNSYHPNPALHR
jgi:hypothetical protein